MGQQAENTQSDVNTVTQLSEVRSRLTREMRRAAEFELQLTQARIDADSLRAQLAAANSENAILAREIHEVREENAQILRSRTWRLTQPIRNLRGGTQ